MKDEAGEGKKWATERETTRSITMGVLSYPLNLHFRQLRKLSGGNVYAFPNSNTARSTVGGDRFNTSQSEQQGCLSSRNSRKLPTVYVDPTSSRWNKHQFFWLRACWSWQSILERCPLVQRMGRCNNTTWALLNIPSTPLFARRRLELLIKRLIQVPFHEKRA